MCMLAIIPAVCRAAGLRRGRPVGATPQLHPAAVAIRTDRRIYVVFASASKLRFRRNHSSEMARPSPLNHWQARQVVLWSLAQQYGWMDCRCIVFALSHEDCHASALKASQLRRVSRNVRVQIPHLMAPGELGRACLSAEDRGLPPCTRARAQHCCAVQRQPQLPKSSLNKNHKKNIEFFKI